MKEKIEKMIELLSIKKMSSEELTTKLGIGSRTLIKWVNIARTTYHYPVCSSRNGGYWLDSINYQSPVKQNAATAIKQIRSLEGSEGIKDVFKMANSNTHPNQISLDL